ncbi:SUMF1/EgtB/PvdO family nonheme iron enzyme [Rhizobium sp. BR 317]|uniref:SUMF1/EgtB/PvdO family nonheme iron enzyme n=1 Tax=Rhizobium sp. BR 317 TaxID=3040015 RepID=UPI0039BFC60E
MTPHAVRRTVSELSIIIPLAILGLLSGALAEKAGLLSFEGQGVAVVSPEVVTIAPHAFEYRDVTEYFRNGLAIDAPKRQEAVVVPLDVMKYQVTQAEYERCVSDAACIPSEAGVTLPNDSIPVTGVSYDDALRYAAWLSHHTGQEWTLPTDFELAYAAADRFPDDALGIDPDDRNPAKRWLADYEREARRSASVDPRPQPKGSFGISQTGLVDFAGNIWEWTSTCNRRIDLDKTKADEDLDPSSCGVMITAGRHRSPMNSFVRNPKGGGCSVGAPPDNLGFRLVRRPSLLESIVNFARRATAQLLATIIKT